MKINGRPAEFTVDTPERFGYTPNARLIVYDGGTPRTVIWVGEMKSDVPNVRERLARIARRHTKNWKPKPKAGPLPVTILTKLADAAKIKDGTVYVTNEPACGLTYAYPHFNYGVEIAGKQRVAEFRLLGDAVEYARYLSRRLQ